MSQYPWYNTTEDIASQDDTRYETPGGAQAKADQAEQDAKDYTDAKLNLPELPIANGSIVERHIRSENVTERTIAQKAVTRSKLGDGAVGSQQLDSSLLQNYGDIAVQASLFKKIEKVDNVAALKASNFAVGATVETLGYNFRADSGGGTYLISNNPVFVDNGGTVIALNNGNKAVLQYERGVVNVKQFGAVGNGDVDDTAAVLAALSLLITTYENYKVTFYNGGTLYFPPGIYLVKSQLVATLNIKFKGVSVASFKARYPGQRSDSTIRFTLSDPNQPAIRFVGYDEFGNIPSSLYLSLIETAKGTISSDNAQMQDINIETTNNSLLGINLVNSTVARFENVGVFNFKYGVLANQCWGSSFEKMFIIASYVPFIFYYGGNGSSIRDSYLTTSINTVIPSSVGIPFPELNMYQYPLATVGLMILGGVVSYDNIVIEGAAVAVKKINTVCSGRVLHAERIKTAWISSTNSKFTLDTSYLFNPDNTSIPMINAVTSNAQLSNMNCALNLTTVIDASSKVVAMGIENITLNDYEKVIVLDNAVSKDITFNSDIVVEFASGNAFKKAYREGRTVNIEFRCSMSTPPTVSSTITVGTVPAGFRPKINYSVNTYYGVLSINASTGVITFKVNTSTAYFLYESISYGM